ncbi:surface lipoprotein assembly modifier [Acinetobacter seifertii]|uniref:surface lipoprotein assembly modifier n=1 Tax=Acinetobacter seifertii TaxID=1530123 RepID=UPI003218EADF
MGQNILGHSRYSHNYGAGLEYNRLLSNRWQVSANTSHIQKRYQIQIFTKYYNGHANSQAALMLYQPKSKLLIYSGLDWMQDRLADEAESSNKRYTEVVFILWGLIGY